MYEIEKNWFVEVSLHYLDRSMDLEIWEVMLFVKGVEIKKSIEIDRRPPHPSPLIRSNFFHFHTVSGEASATFEVVPSHYQQ